MRLYYSRKDCTLQERIIVFSPDECYNISTKYKIMTMDGRAKVSVIISIIGFVLLTLIMISAFSYISSEFGGIENYLEYYYEHPADSIHTYPDTL